MQPDVKKLDVQVRYANWMKIIQECRNSGIPVARWCKQNGVKESSYYYYLKRIRERIVQQGSDNRMEDPLFFPVPRSEHDSSYETISVYRGEFRIEVHQDTDINLIRHVLEAFR